LQFLGDVPDLDDIALDLDTASHMVQFGGLGTFPGVIWLGLREGAEILSALAAEVATQLGLEEQRQDHPHLTIARVKQRIRARDLPEVQAVGEQWCVDEAVLYESTLRPQGATYRACRAWPLRAGS
jgi:2'-5' RNA ligase